MAKYCRKCRMIVQGDSRFCKNCGTRLKDTDYCPEHKIKLNSQGECEACIAQQETACEVIDAGPQTYVLPRAKRRIYKGTSKIINRILIISMILFLVSSAVLFGIYKYPDRAQKIFASILPKNQTSGYVIGEIKRINELQVLRINKAVIYNYSDDKNRMAQLILRYYINVDFDLEKCSVVKNDDGSFTVDMDKPNIKAYLINENVETTTQKAADSYPGMEIFKATKIPFTQAFEMGEIKDIAQKYIDKTVENEKASYIKQSEDNFRTEFAKISSTLNLNIKEIRFRGDE